MQKEYQNFIFFFFNDTATTEIYTLSLHDALPIFDIVPDQLEHAGLAAVHGQQVDGAGDADRSQQALEQLVDILVRLELAVRSEEHTSELQSRQYLVCRLLLEKNLQMDL